MKVNLIELAKCILVVASYFGIIFMVFEDLITVSAFAVVSKFIRFISKYMDEVVCHHIDGMAQSMDFTYNYLNFNRSL